MKSGNYLSEFPSNTAADSSSLLTTSAHFSGMNIELPAITLE